VQSEFVGRTYFQGYHLLKIAILNILRIYVYAVIPQIYSKKVHLKLYKIVCKYLFSCMHAFIYVLHYIDYKTQWLDWEVFIIFKYFYFFGLLEVNVLIPPTKKKHDQIAPLPDVTTNRNYSTTIHAQKMIVNSDCDNYWDNWMNQWNGY